MYIVDRRLNPGGKSLENRQRFLRRAKALVQGAVKKSSQDRDIRDVLEGGEVSIPLDGMNEPRFRREGGTRDMVLPGNKKFVEGDMLPRSGEGRGKASGAGEGDSEDAFRFVLSRDEFVDLFLDDLELPDLAKRKLAEAESEGLRRAGYSTSGSPAKISVSRTVQLAMARRIALRRPRPETIAQLEAEIADCDEARRVELMAELDALKAKFRRIPYIDPIDIRYRRFETMPKPVARRHVLSDGRVGLNVRAYEGSGQALLHAALRVSDEALSPRRDRLHSSYQPGGRRYLLSRTGIGRYLGVERAAGDARDRQVAVSPR